MGSAELPITQLRMFMEISSPRDRLGFDLICRCVDGRTTAIGILSEERKAAKQTHSQRE
jgi:hypothetical protein